MKVLFAFAGGNGHLQPLIPIARSLEKAGHQIQVACPHTMQAIVSKAGFTPLLLGDPPAAPIAPPERIALQPIDITREENDLRENFARRGAAKRIPNMLKACEMWQPDVIICDEVDFGSIITAEYLRIPHVSVVVIASGAFIRPEIVAEPLNDLRAQYGLAPDPDLAMLERHLMLVPVPERFRHPAYPLPPTAHLIQPFKRPDVPAPLPHPDTQTTRPTVYFTLGTVFNTESGDLFSTVLKGLHPINANVIVTVGQHIDPAEFGIQPAHIHIAQYIPQLDVLPHCDLVISHGGSGTVIASLAHGLPMLLLPMGADQLHNADRCQALGVGKTLDATQATPRLIADSVQMLLNTPDYRARARQLQTEIEALPTSDHAVALIEQLVTQNRASG